MVDNGCVGLLNEHPNEGVMWRAREEEGSDKRTAFEKY